VAHQQPADNRDQGGREGAARMALYRPIEPSEHRAVAQLMVLGLMVGAKTDEYVERTEPGEFRVMEDGGEITSALRLDRQAQWWLGRALPSAQVLQLATPPQYRGAGHGGRLLAGLLEELHADGVPLATLTPSTFPFYRAAGFEVAGSWTLYEARAEHLPKHTDPYRGRPVSLDDPAELAEVYRRVAPSRHGALDRGERFWRQLAARTKDKTTAAFVLDGPGGPAGWAVATLEFRPEPAPFQTRVEVADWGCLPGADAALFALFAGYAPMNGVVAWSGPDPDPAALYALRDRFARLTDRWHWMLRVVDLPAALQARPWPAGVTGRVDLRVDDPRCPWNTGAWRLELAGGQGRVEPAPATPDAVADVRGLASLFTGFAGPDDLLRAGLLNGFDPAAVDLLRAAFASPRPWTAEFY
jgi:predicted acetyltransferase